MNELLQIVSGFNEFTDAYWFDPEAEDITFLTIVDAEITLAVSDSMGLFGQNYENWRASANI